MFTVKLYQMCNDRQERTIIETHAIVVRQCRQDLVTLQLVNEQHEGHRTFYLTPNGVEAAGIGDLPYYEAIIENAAGKTTEIIRP